MASSPETSESNSDGEASKEMCLKLQKLEDQLGLRKWTTWSEVKLEPTDDFEEDSSSNSGSGRVGHADEGGMEWVQVKKEPPDDSDLYRSACPNGIPTPTTAGRGSISSSGEISSSCRISSRTHVNSSGSSNSASSPEVTSVAVPVQNGAATSAINHPHHHHHHHHHQNTTTLASPQPTHTSPQQRRSASATQPPEGVARSMTNSVTTSPNVSGMHALKIQSPATALKFVSVASSLESLMGNGNAALVVSEPSTLEKVVNESMLVSDPDGLESAMNRTGTTALILSEPSTLEKVVSESNPALIVSGEPMDMADITASELTAVDDQVMEGLMDVVVAVSSSSPTRITLKRAGGGGGRHSNRKGKRTKKAEKAPLKKVAVPAVKKVPRKKAGRAPKVKENHAPERRKDGSSAQQNHVDVEQTENHTNVVSHTEYHIDDVKKTHSSSKSKKKSDSDSSITNTKDKGVFPLHPKMGKRKQSGENSAYNLFRLAVRLLNEESAVEFLQQFKLLPRFGHCPICGQRLEKLYRIVRQGKRPLFRYQCNKQPCKLGKNQVPLRLGTKYVSSNLSLRKAIILDYCFIKKYDIPTAKAETCMPECEDSDRMVSTSTETVVDYYNHCREICARYLMTLPLIGGLGYTVELYESFFVGSKSHNQGGSKSHKVHAFQGQYVLAGICIENNDVLFATSPDLEPGTVLPLLQSKVALGTHLRTSSCEAYGQLKTFGYEHTVVKDTQLFVHNDLNFSGCSNVTQAGTMRPLTFHRRSGTFNLHLAEYLWRRRHREAPDVFTAYLETVASVYPISKGDGEEVDAVE